MHSPETAEYLRHCALLDWYRDRAAWHGSQATYYIICLLKRSDLSYSASTRQVWDEQTYNHAREAWHWAQQWHMLCTDLTQHLQVLERRNP